MSANTMFDRGIAIAIAIAATFFAVPASAEVFILRSGGQIEGLHVNREDKWAAEYVVRTADGGEITIARGDVKEVVRRRDAEVAYDRVAPSYADTVDDQLKLADWCREHYLSVQEKAHLQRVVELEPDNARVRARLKHRQYQGEWLTEKEIKERQGLVFYRGKWRTKQEVELVEQRSLTDQKHKAWFQTFKRLREDLDSRDADKSALARAKLLEINDPYAVSAIKFYYDAENDKRVADPARAAKIRLGYVKVLGNIDSPEAIAALVDYSLGDADNDVCMTSFEIVGRAKASASTNRYILALHDKDNNVVQRAAIGLRLIGDRRAVGPLIEALVTQHTFELPTYGSTGNGAINTTFDKSGGSTGGGGLGVNTKPRRVRKSFFNEEVRNALVTMTKQDFQFDKALWTKWFGTQKEVPAFDGRRD
ncbi:MAG: hypothetical protein WD875_06355 [Pirellulales bacterium]